MFSKDQMYAHQQTDNISNLLWCTCELYL